MNQSLLRRFLLLLGLAALVTATQAQDIQVVSYTNTLWTYNDSSTAANNPGTAWKSFDPGLAAPVWSMPGGILLKILPRKACPSRLSIRPLLW